MKAQIQTDCLLDQKVALSAYLDDLLLNDDPVPVEESVSIKSLVPEWAKQQFQALMFEVAGITLAVPLIKLKGVVANESEINTVPGMSPLQLGIFAYQGIQSQVVDTRKFIMPEKAIGACDNRPGHLVVIDGGRLALACNAIGNVVDLQADDVKWRGATGKRPWLAGTVIEKMCALLDIDGLIVQLNEKMA